MTHSEQPGPLKGVRVIEMGTLIAGPYAGALLAQFGAEVIKIESPSGGDPLRKWRKLHEGTSLWWYSQSRNKKSLTLNLKLQEGQAIIKRLVATADILIENFRPGLLESWGLGWEQLSAINPNLIMVRVSGYGQNGPYSKRPGFAAIAESMGGLRYVSGYPDRPPVRVGVSLGDSLASLYSVIGALMAMHHLKSNGGVGQYIDVALYESVFGIMESLIPEYAMFDHIRERTGSSLPGISPSNTYPCSDGRYVIIAGNGDGIFKRLMVAMGHPELADDPRFTDNAARVQHNGLLDELITAWTMRHTLEDALQILDEADVPSGKIYSAADIATDPQFASRGMIEKHTLPDGQSVDLPGIVPKLSATPGSTQWVGPQLGEHTAEILESIGVSSAEAQQLKAAGVI
ncbi:MULTISPECIES: CaiB/BaiF CoA transferase family protein [unclassified Pseudomonas]|uniref:CaiB/BaiF CoA transferase family protein n=1 Tax=unclassified Pseudomonas TaxID=196821 RepID=UPI0035C158BD